MLLNTIKLLVHFPFHLFVAPIILDSLFATPTYLKIIQLFSWRFHFLMILGICIGVGMMLREFYIFRFVIGKQPYKLQFDQYQPNWN